MSWKARLKESLSNTSRSIGKLLFNSHVDETLFEELETALIMSDAGLEATEKLMGMLRQRAKEENVETSAHLKKVLHQLLVDHLTPLEQSCNWRRTQPLIMVVMGVNGSGKTTTVGKLAMSFQRQGAKILLAAADTFRAAACEQLMAWATPSNIRVLSRGSSDPASVAFDAVKASFNYCSDVVVIDTAGRLPKQLHLMEELKKICRVVKKVDSTAPHEVLLVIDGNMGQNVLAQVRAFDEIINITGLVVTKLDGTAKGGILVAIACGSCGVRPIPVFWIGMGESFGDLQPFSAEEFASALLGD